MKTKFLSVILCLIALGGVWLLIDRTTREPEVFPHQVEPETEETSTVPVETEVSDAFVVQTAHNAEDLMTRLAYTRVDNVSEVVSDLLDRLDRSAAYLKDTKADYYGATYFLKIAQILEDVTKNPFTDGASFSSRVGMILTELANTYPSNAAPEGLYYPAFDSEPNGTTALAMLALFRRNVLETSGSILLTFGGNLTMGDTVLGAEEDDSFKARSAASEYDYPLYQLGSILQNDTVSFVNLETPLTNSSDAASVSGSAKGSPAYAELLKNSGVEIVSVANNGVKNYGDTGYKDTLKALKEKGVEYVENGTILYHETEAGTIAYISYNIINQIGKNVNLTAGPNTDIAHAREKGAKLVVVNFNWVNTEANEWDPSMSQVVTARNAVDRGADLVFSTHPESMESIERYKGVSIIYSPGNLSKNGTTPRTAFLYQQAFTINEGGVSRGEIRVYPIVTSHDSDGVPYLLLDATSANSFLNTIKDYSNPVKYGVGKKADFPLSDLNVISLSK